MKLSILDSLEIARGASSAEALRTAIGLAQLGDELGLARYWMVEHHGFGHELCPAPDVLAGAVAAGTKHIRVGVGGMLVNRSPNPSARWKRSIRGGSIVRDEFIALGRLAERTPEQEAHLTAMKQDMADRLLSLPAAEAYDVDPA